MVGRKKTTIAEFIEKSKGVHDDRYDYRLTTYTGAHDKVTIICPRHGQFEVRAEHHLHGFGCKRCKPEEAFLKKANKIYKNKFDYSKIKFTRMCDPVEIICPVHQSFFITPSAHLHGNGCRKCNSKN